MADKKKKQSKVYMIPECETRNSHTYHYTAIKTKNLTVNKSSKTFKVLERP